MEFYTYAYVVQRGEFTSLLQYIMTSILLVALLVVGVKIMYNRFDTKFRDLGIIIVLGLVFLLGLQVNDYTRDVVSMEEAYFEVTFTMNKDGYSLRPVEMINSNPKVVDVKKDGR